jgi:hypothetical protein
MQAPLICSFRRYQWAMADEERAEKPIDKVAALFVSLSRACACIRRHGQRSSRASAVRFASKRSMNNDEGMGRPGVRCGSSSEAGRAATRPLWRRVRRDGRRLITVAGRIVAGEDRRGAEEGKEKASSGQRMHAAGPPCIFWRGEEGKGRDSGEGRRLRLDGGSERMQPPRGRFA